MASVPPRDLARVLDACGRLEQAHAQLYRTLAQVHAYDARISALWAKTAREEDGHVAQFRLAAAGYHATIATVNADLGDILRLLEAVESFEGRTRATPPTIAEALRAAIHFEEAMAALHLDKVAEFNRPADRNLFRAMMAADREHVQALRDALAEAQAALQPR